MNKLRELLDPELSRRRLLKFLSNDGERHGIDEKILYVCNGEACGGWCSQYGCKHTEDIHYALYHRHNDFDRETIYDDELNFGISRLLERIR